MGISRHLASLTAGIAVSLVAFASGTKAEEQSQNVVVDIPAGNLSAALVSLARKYDRQILFPPKVAYGKVTEGVHGSMTPETALVKLLNGTGLSYRLSENVIVVFAPTQDGATEGLENNSETITVTGFRNSLANALLIKREIHNASDTILSEDIAKFPALNLAEALQRIPGVVISRSAGEGNQVTVRGLGPEFTRVRINGMETLATAGSTSLIGTNRNRGFDFNVFASDLFSQLTVYKSSSADLQEGSLGATIEMRTGRPFDNSAPVLAASFQYGFNNLSRTFNPRLALLASDLFANGKLGVLVSAAYGSRTVIEQGYSTVRFTNDNTAFSDEHNAPLIAGCQMIADASSQCNATQRVRGVLVTSIIPETDPAQQIGVIETSGGVTKANNYDAINEAFRPRFARYDLGHDDEKRLGLTTSVQWQPGNSSLVTVDVLYADYQMARNEYYLENNSFANSFAQSSLGGTGTPVSLGAGNVLVTDYSVDLKTNTIIKMTGNGFGLRDEAFYTTINSKFEQITIDARHSFSDHLSAHALVGWSESHMRNPIQTNITYDYNGGLGTASGGTYNGVIGFVYDFSGGYDKMPGLYWGSAANADGSVTSTTSWFLSQLRERQEYVFNSYRTGSADISYQIADALKVETGTDYKDYGYHTINTARSNGTTANQDYTIPTQIRAADIKEYTTTVSLRGSGAPLGAGTTFLAPDIDAWNKAFNIFDPTVYSGAFRMGVEPALSNNGAVRENDMSFWIKIDWDSQIAATPVRGDVGVRWVNTRNASTGYSYNPVTATIQQARVTQNYETLLPSLNVIADLSERYLIRFNAALTLSRPGLTDILPGATVLLGGANRTVSVGNPHLKPFKSKNVDLAFEWYYTKGAMLSTAIFYKHIDTLVQSIQQNIVYHGNPFGLPDSLVAAACGNSYGPACNERLVWSFVAPQNTKGSPLYGAEINWQQPFSILPSPFDNIGLLSNITFVQARQYYYRADGTLNTHADLSGLSRLAYSATLYYDDGRLQTRAVASYRSKYIAGINPGNLNDQLVSAQRFNLDASASYRLSDKLVFTAEGINLTGENLIQYVDSIGKRPYARHQTGREFMVGLRYIH